MLLKRHAEISSNCRSRSLSLRKAARLLGAALPLCLWNQGIPWRLDLLLIPVLSHSPADCLALSILFPFTQLGSFSLRDWRDAETQVVNSWTHSKLKNLHLNKVKMGIRATSVTWAIFHNIQLIERCLGFFDWEQLQVHVWMLINFSAHRQLTDDSQMVLYTNSPRKALLCNTYSKTYPQGKEISRLKPRHLQNLDASFLLITQIRVPKCPSCIKYHSSYLKYPYQCFFSYFEYSKFYISYLERHFPTSGL